MDTFSDYISTCFRDCLGRLCDLGFVLPLTVSLMTAAGVVYVGRCTGAWHAWTLHDIYVPAEPLQLPLYGLVVDARGEVGSFIIAPHVHLTMNWPPIPPPDRGH
jgi:hypothetical protein